MHPRTRDSRRGVNVGRRFPTHLFRMAFFLLLIAVISASASAQDDDPDVHITPRAIPQAKSSEVASLDTHTKPFEAETDLVLVPVTITDPEDRIVTGLGKNNFAIFENKQEEHIQSFSCEDAPISLGVIFDMSGSMSDKMDKAREAIVDFLKSANPEDEFFLVGFSNRPEIISHFTTQVEDIQNKLIYTTGKGRTALLDAIYLGMNEMRRARHRRKALLIISDGGDNNSRYTDKEIKSMVEEADIQMFAIGIFDLSPQTEEEREGPSLLSEITDATGGRTFPIGNINELPDVAEKIAIDLRNEYVIGYSPAKKIKDGKWHKIKVKLIPPKGLPPLSVYAKKGYYAPEK
jgi:Ca-activated chloride channel homolog